MDGNKILQQFHAMFGVFMVVFYVGTGLFLLFFVDRTVFRIDKAMRVILGSAFLFFGIYRIFTSYKQIREAFFRKENE